jgi:CRP-like cAMP-binding protein
LACHIARLRLAQALVNLARDIGGNIREGIEIAVTNEDLANAANVTPFTASRLLSEWNRRGALTKSRGKILLRFPQRLFTREV